MLLRTSLVNTSSLTTGHAWLGIIPLAGLGFLPLAADAGTQTSLDMETGSYFESIQRTGDSSNRIDINFIGDGYTGSERTLFIQEARNLADAIFNPGYDPFLAKYKNYFNIQAVGFDSETSTRGLATSGFASAKTALGGTMAGSPWYDNTGHWKDFPNTAESRMYAAQNINSGTSAAPNYTGDYIKNSSGISLHEFMGNNRADSTIVLINSMIYGGRTQGNKIVMTGDGSSAREVFIHEYAHSLANLGDEYTYTQAGGGGDLNKANLIVSDTQPTSGKWDYWIEYQKEHGTDGTGLIGYYEGGGYKSTGVWRPSENSKMRTLGTPFDPVSREAFILAIYKKVRPIDSVNTRGVTDSSQLVNYVNFQTGDDINGGFVELNPDQTLSLSVIDPDVIFIEWYADGILTPIAGANNVTDFNPLVYGFATGESHFFWAKCFDKAEDSVTGYKWVLQDPDDLLSQSVYWTVSLIPEPSTYALCFATLGIGVALLRRRKIS